MRAFLAVIASLLVAGIGAILLDNHKYSIFLALAGAPAGMFLCSFLIASGKKYRLAFLECYLWLWPLSALLSILIYYAPLWLSLSALPFVAAERFLRHEKLSRAWRTSLFLIGLGMMLTAISGWHGMRKHSLNISCYDLKYLLLVSFLLGVIFLLDRKIVSWEKIIFGLLGGNILFLLIAFLLALKSGNFGPGIRFGEGTLLNPNTIAMQLEVFLPLAGGAYLIQPGRKNLIWLSVFGAFLLAILLTVSRGSLPGIVFSVLFVIWHKRRSKAFMICVICACVLLLSVVGPMFAERLLQKNGAAMGSNLDRVFLWDAAWKMICHNHFIYGIGMDRYTLEKFFFGVPYSVDPDQTLSSHNIYLEIALGWGVFAAAGWCLLFGNVCVRLLLNRSEDQKKRIMMQAIAFGLVAFSVHGLVDSVMRNLGFLAQLAMLLAVADALLRQSSSESLPALPRPFPR